MLCAAAHNTYVWTLAGFVYTSFVTDVFSRRILGWRVSASKTTPLVMSPLEQALFTRRRHDVGFTATGLVFHSDAGSQPGFKESSQRCSVRRSIEVHRGLRRVSSIRASCGVAC